MANKALLDVSLKEVSIRVVDEDGKVVARGVASADPNGVAGRLKGGFLTPERIAQECGMLSIRLRRGFAALGLPATCIDAREAHMILFERIDKSNPAERC
jgi:transposase